MKTGRAVDPEGASIDAPSEIPHGPSPVRAGLLLLGCGALLVVLGMAMAALAKDYNRSLAGLLPYLAVAGLGFFGLGVHRVLWAPPRNEALGSYALRVVVSGVVAVASVMLLSCVTGFVAAILFAALRHR